MQPGPARAPLSRPPLRAPASLSALAGPPSPSSKPQQQGPARPPPLRVGAPASDDSGVASRARDASPATATPIYSQFTAGAASPVHHGLSRAGASSGLASPLLKGHHARKLSATQGLFDSTLPSTSMSNQPQASKGQPSHAVAAASSAPLSASQMAAKAAVMSHQNPSHVRQRSQTVPFPGEAVEGTRRSSGSKVPLSPPLLSLTEASLPHDTTALSGALPGDRPAASHSATATTAANVVFPRSGHNTPRDKSTSPQPFLPVPPALPEKPPTKADKPKVKLFSRPAKIATAKADAKDKALPSPSKIGTALSALQRGNFSANSLVDPPPQPIYNLGGLSAAAIRPADTAGEEKAKEKKHHFLSRQKQKLKDEYHLPLSSASSNSKPTDPSAPSSLYNFNVPASPGPGSSSFAKTKKEKKLAERAENRLDHEPTFNLQGEWSAAANLPPLPQHFTLHDPVDAAKLGLQHHLSLDDVWPYLKAKLLVIFEGEDLRVPVEDFNRVVQMHIQWCIHKRAPGAMLDDVREMLETGFSSLDRTLRLTPEDHFVPTLVELWLFTFTSILPYMQSIFLPLELEASGCGAILAPEQARDFWSGVVTSPLPAEKPARAALAASMLDIRRLVLTAYRDVVILPCYELLKSIFSRLSLEFLPSLFANMALASPAAENNLSTSPSESLASMVRPGTAMSLDPSVGSYNSSSTTLLGEGSERGRSRAVSNVSFGSHASDGGAAVRPFTPSGVQVLGRVREQNVEDSKQVTDMVGRLLQCTSVLASLGGADDDDDDGRRVVELGKLLKLNWLGRGRTGRNRRGIVGGKVRRDEAREEVRVA